MTGNDYQKMAGAFLNIWQEQLSKSMTDGDFISQMTKMMRQFQPTGTSGHDETNRHTAYASHAQSDELAHLQQRLAACERRLKQLEAWVNTPKPEPEPEPAPVTKARPKPASTKTSRRDEPERGKQPAKPSRAKAATPSPAPPKPFNPTRKIIKRAVKRK